MTTGQVPHASSPRISSIDALRGLTMFVMIFVNDLAGAGDAVPDWMVHYSDRHGRASGMTFVDVVFPAFLFVAGMSIPFALGSRLAKGESVGSVAAHVVKRTLALLLLGILMVNGTPDSKLMGWSGHLWEILMLTSGILAFCTIKPPGTSEETEDFWRYLSLALRIIGFIGLAYLAFAFRGHKGRRIIEVSPFSLHASWYGILGIIGWAYLAASIVFLVFRTNRTALLGCMVLLLCLYPAEKKGAFDGLWFSNVVDLGETVGAHAAIVTAGLLLASILVAPDRGTHRSRAGFALLFIAGCAAGAMSVKGLYGIRKNDATPSWCLWCCAITAALWLVLYYLCDVSSNTAVAKPLAIAGQNVLLAYLISEALPSFSSMAGPSLAGAISLAAACAFLLLLATGGLNRVGFRLQI